MALKFFNSLSKQVEPFAAASGDTVGMYACGPTVYNYVTVGNWRTYTLADVVARTLRFEGYKVRYFMNITDVGHLTGDNAGDADTGEDRMEKAKAREGKTAREVAAFYTEDFKRGYAALHLAEPERFLPATEYIPEQIALVAQLEGKGLAYRIGDGMYFDTQAYEKLGFSYGELSDLDRIKAGARVEFNPEKRDLRDFALWKFSPAGAKRDMEWPSPWGVGFPGWHIECSAMSMRYLGEQFDIHIGGEDLKSTHHPNEIAQSQGATGKSPFVRFWLHGAFLQVDGGRMGKSLGNAFTLDDIGQKGFSPLSLRYFYFSGHYRSPLNFTWEGLAAADTTLKRLRGSLAADLGVREDMIENGIVDQGYRTRFLSALEDDLNMPAALAVLHSLAQDKNISPADKMKTALNFDEVLGLDLGIAADEEEAVPEAIFALAKEREQARKAKDWTRSDELRDKIAAAGYAVRDTDGGSVVEKQ